ncbi:Pyruvate decarboxylase [Hirsutella minnesotensis 3608]|nr:Pyruvate decarboxylase [Hirsutella minnesotensis 3608]
MSPCTVGDYLAERLAQIGIRHHFMVPGDYNLILLDKLEAHPQLTGIGCTNELNCSLAAEGYARAHGVSVCVVTYSVGTLPALNGIGSAYAENLPVILVSGAPNTNDGGHHLLHHTLGEHDFSYRSTWPAALIDGAIVKALAERKPVYVEMPTNLPGELCVQPGPLSALMEPAQSDGTALAAAVASVTTYLATKQKPVILVGPKVRRAGAQRELVSTLAADAIVNWTDVLLGVGTVFTDYSTVGWTAMPSVPLIVADMDSVIDPDAYFSHVRLADFMSTLAGAVGSNDSTLVEYNRLRLDPSVNYVFGEDDKLTRKHVSQKIQALLTGKTTVFDDAGDSWFNGIQLRLPRGAEFEIEMQWGHIGWSIPASFGYALGKPQRRTIVMEGDGAFQMTAQEVSQMVRFHVSIIILLMNNRGYTIEVEIHDGLHNRIQNWNYAALVKSFATWEGDHVLDSKHIPLANSPQPSRKPWHTLMDRRLLNVAFIKMIAAES